jgi:acyl carrier protein
MNKEEITGRLTSVFETVFGQADIRISRETTAQDIGDWDSLRHIQLITAVETDFKIKFKLRELMVMKSVGDLIDLIDSHTKKV